MSTGKNRITDIILNENFEQYDTGYWRINGETVISCEGQVYAENDDNTLVWYAEVNFIDELQNLLTVLKCEKDLKLKQKVICYCGSLRVAMEAFKKAEYEAVLNGEIALLPCCMFVDIEREYGSESDYKLKADDLHKRKIDICDEVHVLNVGGYIGSSTQSEIEHAKSIGKVISYLEE